MIFIPTAHVVNQLQFDCSSVEKKGGEEGQQNSGLFLQTWADH